jgi:hypothetical protein
MLDRSEQRPHVTADLETGDFPSGHAAQELADLPPARAFDGADEDAVVLAEELSARLAVGRDPQVASRIDFEVVRTSD